MSCRCKWTGSVVTLRALDRSVAAARGGGAQWLLYINPLHYAYEALLINEFAEDVTRSGEAVYYGINGSICAPSLPYFECQVRAARRSSGGEAAAPSPRREHPTRRATRVVRFPFARVFCLSSPSPSSSTPLPTVPGDNVPHKEVEYKECAAA